MIKKEIESKELIECLNKLEADKMSVFMLNDGLFRGCLFNATRFVNQIRLQHNLGILETMILGQASICSALLIPMMKEKGKMIIKANLDGPVEGYCIEIDSSGYLRGYLLNDNIYIDKPVENWDLSKYLGKGTLTVSRLNENDKFPYESSVEIGSGNIAKDFASYFNQSDQLNTAFNSSIQLNSKGEVIGAGGMYLQYVPTNGGIKKDLEATIDVNKISIGVENAFSACPSVGKWFSENGNHDDLIFGLFREFNPVVLIERNIVFDCPCNESYYLNIIKNMDTKTKENIFKDDEFVEITCKNCGSKYKISTDEVK